MEPESLGSVEPGSEQDIEVRQCPHQTTKQERPQPKPFLLWLGGLVVQKTRLENRFSDGRPQHKLGYGIH